MMEDDGTLHATPTFIDPYTAVQLIDLQNALAFAGEGAETFLKLGAIFREHFLRIFIY